MPSLATWSMRGVGIVPPYTPKFPQPTLSTRMNTTFGFYACGLGLGFMEVLRKGGQMSFQPVGLARLTPSSAVQRLAHFSVKPAGFGGHGRTATFMVL